MTSFRAELDYLRQLAGAGWNGINAARQDFEGPVFEIPKAGNLWTPAAVCAGIGLMSGKLLAKRQDRSTAAERGLLGGLVGSTAMLAWSSRRFARHATRKAIRSVNAVRDRHWLEANPIDYA